MEQDSKLKTLQEILKTKDFDTFVEYIFSLYPLRIDDVSISDKEYSVKQVHQIAKEKYIRYLQKLVTIEPEITGDIIFAYKSKVRSDDYVVLRTIESLFNPETGFEGYAPAIHLRQGITMGLYVANVGIAYQVIDHILAKLIHVLQPYKTQKYSFEDFINDPDLYFTDIPFADQSGVHIREEEIRQYKRKAIYSVFNCDMTKKKQLELQFNLARDELNEFFKKTEMETLKNLIEEKEATKFIIEVFK